MIQGKTLICTETARKYLMNIDCYFKGHTKGIYFERHEDDDVRKHRNTVFLPEIRRALHKSYWWLSMPLAEAMQLLAPAKNGSDGALTIDDFTRADIFRRERTPDSKFKYTQISSGIGALRMETDIPRTCETDMPNQLETLTDIFVQWSVDDFSVEFVRRFEDRFPAIANQKGEDHRSMYGMLNLGVDWDCNKPVLIMDQDECIVKCGEYAPKYWQHKTQKCTQAKTDGSGFMLSAFRLWSGGGFLKISPAEKAAIEKDLRSGKAMVEFEEHAQEGVWYSYRTLNYGKGRDGYWDGERMSVQADEVIDAMEYCFPAHEVTFIFDWSSCHDKAPPENVAASHFLLEPGYREVGKTKVNDTNAALTVTKGDKKPFTCAFCLDIDKALYPNCVASRLIGNKIWFRFLPGETPIGHTARSKQQTFGEWVDHGEFMPGDMSPADGDVEHAGKLWRGMPKGLNQLHHELGLPVGLPRTTPAGSGEPSMNKTFDNQHFISDQPSLLARVIGRRHAGHTCLMLPKCHPEFNPIERVWGRMKQYTRAHNDGKLPTLRANVPVALADGNIPALLHYEYERKSRDYYRAYLDPDTTDPFVAEVAIRSQKEFRSHRGIPPSEYTMRNAKPWALRKAALAQELVRLQAEKVRRDQRTNKDCEVLSGNSVEDDEA
jgi:hypothetical protein